MPITNDNIKLLKSAVNADTPDGGGAMTGNVLIDGASNNLFPDVSAMDGAFGKANLRKLFGVAQSTDSEMLLGSHAVITSTPADQNVAVTLFRTDGWGDTRVEAVKTIEGYCVQGSRVPSLRILDTHYKNSTQLRLYIVGAGQFPTAGDVVVLENPARIGVGDEHKQFVRLQNYESSQQSVTITENGESKDILVNVATYLLEQAIKFDIFGPPITKTFSQGEVQAESFYAKVYSTAIADTARFYGVKPLAVGANIGDYQVLVDSIFSPLVPSNTTPFSITDAQPSVTSDVLVSTGFTSKIEISAGQTTLSYRLPCGAEAGSLVLNLYGTGNTTALGVIDDKKGSFYYNNFLLASIDYKDGSIIFENVEYYTSYGGSNNFRFTLQFMPAALIDCDVLSTSMTVTQANQGTNYVALIRPIPAPGTLKIEYVAEGRWYELSADMSGRIGGSSSAYGAGGINNSTGSMSVSLGAIPDIGSIIIMSFGSNTSTMQPDLASLPTKLSAYLDVGFDVYPTSRLLSWVDIEGDPRSATVSISGVISGGATGQFVSQSELVFTPSHFPNAAGVTLTHKSYTSDALSTKITPNQLDVATGAIEQGSIWIESVWDTGLLITLTDRNGELWGELPTGIQQKLGEINYATGVFAIDPSFTTPSKSYGVATNTIDGWDSVGAASIGSTADKTYLFLYVGAVHYYSAAASGATTTTVLQPTYWQCKVPSSVTTDGKKAKIATGAISLKFAGGLSVFGQADGTLKSLSLSADNYVGEEIGAIDQGGIIRINKQVMPRISSSSRDNSLTFTSCLYAFPSLGAYSGIFRTQNFPLNAGNFQIYEEYLTGTGNQFGLISGGLVGNIDYKYGVVKWRTAGYTYIDPSTLRYNAVALLVLPLNPELLGLDTARLPKDGKVPIYRKGDLVLVHNSQEFTLQDPIQKGVVYDLGRLDLASVRVADAAGVVLPESLFTVDLEAGELIFTVGTDTSAFVLPLAVEHTVEDMALCTSTDINGLLKIARPLAHSYAAGTSYVSSILSFGDLFSRAYGDFAQQAWTSVWSDERIGNEILANYNAEIYPILVNNTGAIRERWALIFTSTTAYRCVGEQSGQIGTGVTTADYAPINPATGLPYFTIRASGFGAGWSTGNVLRFNTDAAGSPFWVLRTVLQGPAQAATDKFRISFRGDVNRV